MACVGRCLLDPATNILISILIVPEIELIALWYLATTFSRITFKVLDLTNVDAKQPIAALDAFRYFVFNPSAPTGLGTYQHSCDRRAHKLGVYPSFYRCVTLPFYFLESRCIDKQIGRAHV